MFKIATFVIILVGANALGAGDFGSKFEVEGNCASKKDDFLAVLGEQTRGLASSMGKIEENLSPRDEAWWPRANKWACKYAKAMERPSQFEEYLKKVAKKSPQFDWDRHYSFLSCTRAKTNVISGMVASEVEYPALKYIFERIQTFENDRYQRKKAEVASVPGLSDDQRENILSAYEPKLMNLINEVIISPSGRKSTLLDLVIITKQQAYNRGERMFGSSVEQIEAYLKEIGALTYQQLVALNPQENLISSNHF